MERITLYEQLRLIERSESEVSGAWKGAHLLLFFLAFVFGSFCTFCFHMLMYLFDEKCVLFPKLLSLSSLRHNVIYEFIPEDKAKADMLPVDFLNTQWLEKSACYLPTYVPLVSGIFGLVWTTMFLMCSTGSRTLTGFQRPWRIIPPVFVFSIAMGGLCVYSSAVTHYGLRELCVKLGEITGSLTCSYTVNVATLAYERRIRGVYQATRLTIMSAWLHTGCWLASALLALARIFLAVDFRLVKIRAELVGSLDQMLERHEEQLRTVSPYHWDEDERDEIVNIEIPSLVSVSSTHIFFHNEQYDETTDRDSETDQDVRRPITRRGSEMSLVPEEEFKLMRMKALDLVSSDHKFIVNMLYDLIEIISRYYSVLELHSDSMTSIEEIPKIISVEESTKNFKVKRQFGKQALVSKTYRSRVEAEEMNSEIKNVLLTILQQVELLTEPPLTSASPKIAGKQAWLRTVSSLKRQEKNYLRRSNSETDLDTVSPFDKKSNLKPEENRDKGRMKQKVTISEPTTAVVIQPTTSSESMKDKETQTDKKEKED